MSGVLEAARIMRPGEAQTRMLAIELHEQKFSGVQFIDWLLGFGDEAATEDALTFEARRAFALAGDHYQRLTKSVAVLNPRMISEVAFIQGATFAAAALGRKPWPAKVED